MNVLDISIPDLKAFYRKRFFLIVSLFNLMPVLYSIRPFLKNSVNADDWNLSFFFMFTGSFGSSLNFGGNYWGTEGGFMLQRFISSCSIKKVAYSKIILSSSIFLVISFMYSILIFYNLSKVPLNMVLFFVGYFLFFLSFLPLCFSYLSIKYPAPTYSSWLYPNRTTPSLVSGVRFCLVVLFPFFIPSFLFYALEQNVFSALFILIVLSFMNFALTKKLIDKMIEVFYRERMTILNKIDQKLI